MLAEIDETVDHLEVTLRLHVAAHEAKAMRGRVAAKEKAGNDGVKGAFGGTGGVGMRGVGGEAERPVLQGNAGAGNNNARAEAPEIGLDEGNHAPVRISGGEVNRAEGAREGGSDGLSAGGIVGAGAGVEVGGGEELLRVHAHGGGFTNMRSRLGEADFSWPPTGHGGR